MKYLAWLVFASLAACAHKPVKLTDGTTLFPYGSYRHEVTVHVLKPEDRTMTLHGVVAVNAESLKVVGLSSLGTTIFRIEENRRTGEVKKEFYLDVVRQHEDRFMEFYAMIKELLLAPKDATEFTRKGAHYVVSDPDDNGIYRQIHITHPQVDIDVEVTDYAP